MNEENIIEEVKSEFNLKPKHLAEMFDVSPSTISVWSTTEPTKIAQLCMEYMLKAKRAEDKLKIIGESQKIMNELSVQILDA